LKGTHILSNEGYVPIETLKIGDLIKTSKNGYVKLIDIDHSTITNYTHSLRFPDRLFIYKKQNNPDLFDDLIVTGGHSLLVDSLPLQDAEKIIQFWKCFYGTEGKIRIPACLDSRSTPYELAGEFDVYHIVLDHSNPNFNYGVFANGMLAESCSEYAMEKMRYYNHNQTPQHKIEQIDGIIV